MTIKYSKIEDYGGPLHSNHHMKSTKGAKEVIPEGWKLFTIKRAVYHQGGCHEPAIVWNDRLCRKQQKYTFFLSEIYSYQ